MKKASKILILVISLLLGITTKGMAAGLPSPNVTLEGNGVKFLYNDKDGKKFLEKYEMLPGDSTNGTITIKNNLDEPFNVYLRTEDLDEDEKEMSKVLDLSIKYEGKSIYNGNLLGHDNLGNGIELGVVNPGEEKLLDASVTLNGKATDNKYRNKSVDVDWIFTAVGTKDNKKISSIDDGINSSINNLDGIAQKIKGVLPKTGYEYIFGLLVGLIIVVVGILLLLNKKKKNKDGISQ